MDDVTNAQRARWALFALADFVPRTRVNTAKDAIGDLVTDLIHLGRGRGLDTDLLLSNAATMMATEVEEDDEGDMDSVQAAFRQLIGLDD